MVGRGSCMEDFGFEVGNLSILFFVASHSTLS